MLLKSGIISTNFLGEINPQTSSSTTAAEEAAD